MTLPVVYGACAANPECRFVFLTKPAAAKMFLHMPPNLTVEAVDTKAYQGLKGLKRLLSEMCEGYGIDTIVDLHDVLRTKILRTMASFKGLKTVSIDKGRSQKRALTRHHHKKVIPLAHMSVRYREAFHEAGLNVADNFHSLFPSGIANPELFSHVTAPRQNNETWIAIAPFAAHEGKVYPLHLLCKVIDYFAGRADTRLFIFGAGNEEDRKIQLMADNRPNIVNMAAAKAGLQTELALMSHCDALLAMDSANMHLASLVGLRTVSIWGATHPYAGFYGTGQNPADAIQLDIVCRPCSVFGNKPCRRKDLLCLNGISPQLIISRLNAILTKNQTRS